MLTREANSPIQAQGLEYEGLVSELASVMLNERLRALRVLEDSIEDAQCQSLILSLPNAAKFSIRFDTYTSRQFAKASFFEAALRLASYFDSEVELSPELQVLQRHGVKLEAGTEGGQEETAGLLYRLYNEHGESGRAWVTLPSEAWPLSSTDAPIWSPQVKLQLKAVSYSEFDLSGPGVTLQKFDRIWLGLPQGLWQGVDLEPAGQAIRIKIREEQMSEDNSAVQVTLNLGAIEMSLSEALSLRPGMQVEFQKPEYFQATLQYGGSALAEARVEVKESGVSLRITQVIQGNSAI